MKLIGKWDKMKIFRFVLLGLFALLMTDIFGQDRFFLGGSMGAVIPSNWGEKQFDIGFADVSKTGFRAAMEGRWFYNERLSLGAELALSRFGKDPLFWDVNRYGAIDASYTMGQSTLHGCYYFDSKGFMPYVGMGFGAFGLLNRLDFRSNYVGTSSDASVRYQTQAVKPGYSPQFGFLAQISRRSFFFVDCRFQIIPNIKPSQVYVKDELGNFIDVITQNPHGHQNHWVVSTGILFGGKRH